jgi:hypothetical protein
MAQRTAEILPGTVSDRDTSTWWPYVSSVVIIGGYLLVVFFAIYLQRPPEALSSNAPLTDFAAERAMNHLRVIANRPHPIGSTEHAETLAYLQQELSRMGLSPEIQRTTAITEGRGVPYTAATVQNLMARLKGTGNGQAILLVAHFDSAPNSPGASDDGAAVSALLETLRAIQAGAPLKNDLIFLFTDGEEIGLLGAQAFVKEHPWFRDVKVALNFEARGSSGPSVMFETSHKNGWLVRNLSDAVPYPRMNSLMYDIYRLLPNNSDLSVLKAAGVAGLNFAYLDDAPHYHTALDSVQNIDQRSLQHQGSYALSLARHLGNQSLDATASANAVYFDLLGITVVQYSYTWVGPLMVFVLLFFSAVVFLGFRRKRLTLGGIGQGFQFPLVSAIAAVISVAVAWQVISSLHDGYRLMTLGETYNGGYYRLGFVALTIALTSLAYRWFRTRVSEADLLAGALAWWAILLVLTSLFLQGGSYLFVWPLLFAVIGLGLILTTKETERVSLVRSVSFSVCLVPGLVLFVPLIQLLLVGLTISMAAAVMIPVVLLLVLLLPRPRVTTNTSQWTLPAVAAVVSVVFLVAGSLTAGFNGDRRRPNSIFYASDADTGQAVWASQDAEPDQWTQQFFSAGYEQGRLAESFPLNGHTLLKGRGPQLGLTPPDLKVLGDTTRDGVRTLRLLITSSREAPVMSVYEESKPQIAGATINGKRMLSAAEVHTGRVARWGLQYFAVPREGIELTLDVRSTQPVKLRLVDQSYGLPKSNGSFTNRPDFMMAAISSETDSTFVARTFVF